MVLHLSVWVCERILTEHICLKSKLTRFFPPGLKDYLATEQGVNVSIRDCLSPFHDLVILSFAAFTTALRLTVSPN